MLATIVGAPLDLFHFVVGDRLSLLAFYATPSTVEGIIGPFPWSGAPSYVGASTGAGDGALFSSTGVGDGALFFSSTTLLGGGVPAVPSPLVGVLISALSRAGSSATLSIVGTAAGCATGCATGCSGVVCLATIYSSVTGLVGPEPKIMSGSTSEAVL